MWLEKVLCFLLIALFTSALWGQTYKSPFVAAKSNPISEITEVYAGPESTLVRIRIKNIKRDYASFTLKPKFYLESEGQEMNLELESYKVGGRVGNPGQKVELKGKGASVSIELTFPPLPIDVYEFDLVYMEKNNILDFKGIDLRLGPNLKENSLRLKHGIVAIYLEPEYISSLGMTRYNNLPANEIFELRNVALGRAQVTSEMQEETGQVTVQFGEIMENGAWRNFDRLKRKYQRKGFYFYIDSVYINIWR